MREIRLRSQSTNGRTRPREQRCKAKAQLFCFWTFCYIERYFPYYGSQSKVRGLFWTSPNILMHSTHATYVSDLVHIRSPSLVALYLPTLPGFLSLCRVQFPFPGILHGQRRGDDGMCSCRGQHTCWFPITWLTIEAEDTTLSSTQASGSSPMTLISSSHNKAPHLEA